MVAWKNMYPDLSGPVGGVFSVARITPVTGPPVLRPSNTGTWLASPGVVDTNAPTRLQTPALYTGRPGAGFSFTFTSDDVAAYPGLTLTGTLFLAPASAFAVGVVPTQDQIRLAAVYVVRATSNFGEPKARTTAGPITAMADMNYPGPSWAPNEKWWALVCPTAVNPASVPSIANDTPMYGANTHGRAVSFWTNRTPEAPIISTPVGKVVTFAGSEVAMKFSPQDPDRINHYAGDEGPNDFEDLAGVQVQYRAEPTEADPDPAWADLPIADSTGATFGLGWYMDAVVIPAGSENSGAKRFWETHSLTIRCGTTTDLAPYSAYLPTGDWQIRVRTFDFGHERPDTAGGSDTYPPLTDASGSYTPDNYPAANTSPWSASVGVSVSPQVPKPIAISPVGNIAILDGSTIPLVWRYRNTYDPPYPQATRTLRIRRVGDTDWTMLVVDQASELTSFSIGDGTWSGYVPVSGNQYEWQVKVTDSSGLASDWSDPAYFWMVPQPGTGDVIVDPAESIDGATLGCGTHRVMIFRRGGKERVGEVRNCSYIDWGRVRDDISTAKIVVSGWDIDCGNLLASLQTWAYEVVIFRDNGFDVDRVWEGPITLLTYESDSVTIHAKDVMAYAYRRIIKQAMSDSGNSPTAGRSVVARAAAVLQTAFAPDDPNVLSYLTLIPQADDAKQYRSTPEYSRTAFEEVDDMAANAGLDYTAVGRSILLWGTKHRIGTLPEFRDKDLGASPIVSEYGMSMANRYAVSDGNGVWGEATRLDADGKDETYGLVEMLSSTWASDSSAESGTYTEAGLKTIRESFAESAERSVADRYPPPVVVRVPDNTRLNPDTVISIRHLVPGVVVPLRSTSTLRQVRANQKLDSVKVIETNGEETITITLSPFSRDDNELGGGGEEA